MNNLADNPEALRELYVLAGDHESVAELDRKTLGQSRQVQAADPFGGGR